jgi:hypothetical protein
MANLPTEEIAWAPQPRQEIFLRCPADERFFGGAKGGGKTDAMLGDYLRQLKFAEELGVESDGVVFRRSYKELEEVIKRSHQIYPKLGGEFGIAKGTWKFPGYGNLKMRFVERDTDASKYQGHAYDWIAFDELGNYGTPFVWNQLSSCNRSAPGILSRMVATGNPGGPGQGWIKRRWISGKKVDYIYGFEQAFVLEGEAVTHRVTRCFIPSKVTDNKYWVENDPGYIAKLAALPEHQRRAYLEGDWDVSIGQAFGDLTSLHRCTPFSIPRDWKRFATLDWGFVKPYSLGLWAVAPIGRMYRIGEVYGCIPGMEDEGVQKDATTSGKKFLSVTNALGIDHVYADPACWQRHGHGRTIAQLLEDTGLNLLPADRDRMAAKTTFHALLSSTLDDGLPAFMVFDTCEDWWRTVPNLTSDRNNIEDVDTTGEDHAYDDTRFALMTPESTFGVVRANLGDYRKRSYLKEERDYAR